MIHATKNFKGIVKKFRSCEIASASSEASYRDRKVRRGGGGSRMNREAGRVPFGRERRGPVCRSDAAVMSTNIYLIGSAAARRRTLPLCYAGAISILSLRRTVPSLPSFLPLPILSSNVSQRSLAKRSAIIGRLIPLFPSDPGLF